MRDKERRTRLRPPAPEAGARPRAVVFWPALAIAAGFVLWGTVVPDSLAAISGAALSAIISKGRRPTSLLEWNNPPAL